MRPLVSKLVAAAALASAAVLPAGVVKAEYPTKPIEWIIMWSAGGGADTATRIFTKYFEKELGQTVVVRNVTGASGTVGYLTAKAARPDGYTVVSALSDLPKYKPLGTKGIEVDDFDIIGSFAVESPILVARADSDIHSLEDFIEKAKANPGEVTVGVSNIGGVHHQPVVLLEEAAGIDAPVIAHDGSPQMNAALLGGHVDIISSWVKQSLSNVQAGDMNYIAYFGAERLEAFPDVPTAKELGYDIVWEHSYGLGAPKGIPEEAKEKLLAAMKKVWANPDFAADMRKVGLTLHTRGPEYYDELKATEKAMDHVVELMNQ
ncbi:tripartite tricarboxylate transporter substrate binding protein [Pikeienuella piscinae]|uniref:Tripartite tricarboxylate transporter substrate binding protein n=1 Tax=Pikeienuella piscinae TaxID=2748098 RepID=A0A7L5BYT1_9RHOB|nr:tripartite tricarboxylate transporter substrate binding protein [Pikeienuella piscinae]QIE55677.1 tripartite tricarboxylate transporter substrate binding protein [Pikeienuella piscinae]